MSKPWQDLKDGYCNEMSFGAVESVMTGVQIARQDNTSRICLLYTDDSTEIAECPEVQILEASPFGVVAAVQDQRPETLVGVAVAPGEGDDDD